MVWEGPREAAERLGREGLRLWLDLNDPGLTFEYTRKQGDPRVEHAAALILPHVARVRASALGVCRVRGGVVSRRLSATRRGLVFGAAWGGRISVYGLRVGLLCVEGGEVCWDEAGQSLFKRSWQVQLVTLWHP